MRDPGAVILWTGVLAAGGSAGLAGAAPLWNRLGRRYGLRTMLVRALLGLAIAATLMAVADAVWQLLLIRVLQGVLGTVGTVVVAVVVASVAEDRRARVLGRLQIAMVAGSVAGPVAGGLVLYWAGFSLLFGLAAGGALAVVLTTLVMMPRVSPAAAETVATGAPREPGVGRDPGVLGLATYFLALQVAAMMSGGLLVLYVQELGGGAGTAPLTGLIIGSSGVLAALAAPLARRFRERLGSAGGMGATGGLAGLLLLAQGLATALGAVWALRLSQGMITGVLRPSAQSGVQRLVAPDRRRPAYGFVARASTVGSIGGAVLGGVIGALGGLSLAFAVAGGVLVVGAAAPVVLSRLVKSRD